ncbi:putative mfs transporter protein [Neofusicoccum parvum UCRNP2]|uniref:Putative mfs transporter protein n=1 Tax=Botryosphaeria parva (strain UCR-NP2) TaxID=1287680 RepID=R1ELE5_BOTPV|nr:putative mfs transporter protein [Neofusicoccum parvum UCRNP2]
MIQRKLGKQCENSITAFSPSALSCIPSLFSISNLGNARLVGLKDDIDLSGHRPREAQVAQKFANSQPGDYHHEGLQLNQLADAFKDYKNYLFALMNFSCNVSFASLPLFLPTIISELGTFSTIKSNGLSAPPYLLCFLLIIVTAYTSDRLRLRGPFATFSALMSATGFIILGSATSVTARYIGIFFAVQIFVTVAVVLVWNANTNETGSKRAGGLWIMMTVGQCGPLLGTNMFPEEEGPYYRKGMWVSCSFALTAATASALLSFLLWRENKQRDRLYEKPAEGQGQADSLTVEEQRKNTRFII